MRIILIILLLAGCVPVPVYYGPLQGYYPGQGYDNITNRQFREMEQARHRDDVRRNRILGGNNGKF